jgi:hypothetical protein
LDVIAGGVCIVGNIGVCVNVYETVVTKVSQGIRISFVPATSSHGHGKHDCDKNTNEAFQNQPPST